MKKVLFFGLSFLICFFAPAQTRTIKGWLTAFEEIPVMRAKVVAKKSKAEATTDTLGRFTIVVSKNDILKVDLKGFIPNTMKIKDEDSVHMNIVFKGGDNDKKVAVGYGYISERDLTFAITHLSDKNFDVSGYTDIFDMIEGRFPSVRVSRDTNVPEIYIRGSFSLTSENPALYVVDGIKTYDISYIHPQMVKSIDILKDAAASIYGAQGGNGVVVITLKH